MGAPGSPGRRTTFSTYYRAVAGRPSRPTLLKALQAWGDRPPDLAVDLGCGEGRDTVELLRRGWSVVAIDRSAEAIACLRARPALPNPHLLNARVANLETADWPPASLINASFVLPLCRPEAFPAVWRRIVDTLTPGGWFAGQLYGPHDDWAGDNLVIHDRDAVEALLAPFAEALIEEQERDGETALGKPKHWHLFHIVARKPRQQA